METGAGAGHNRSLSKDDCRRMNSFRNICEWSQSQWFNLFTPRFPSLHHYTYSSLWECLYIHNVITQLILIHTMALAEVTKLTRTPNTIRSLSREWIIIVILPKNELIIYLCWIAWQNFILLLFLSQISFFFQFFSLLFHSVPQSGQDNWMSVWHSPYNSFSDLI